ncbi:MFS transporter [candidate division KSB1 bacterium]|nr:MFS transporter [candidate division KSB1 bacterium]
MNSTTSDRIKFGEKLGYSLGDAAANIAWRPLIAFLPIFYTDTFGLPEAAVALLLMITRSFDGVTDVIMGTIADRTNTRHGKFRPWLLWTAVPFGLFLALTFTTPKFAQQGKLIWAYTTYILLTLAYTANNVPYSSLTGVLTGSVKERTSVSSFRFFGAYLGGLISLGLIPILVKYLGKGNDNAGYQSTMYILAGVLVVFSLVAFFSTKERIKPPASQDSSIWKDLKGIATNRPWAMLLALGFLWVTYNSIRQGAAAYYFKWYLGKETLVGVFFIAVVLASIASTFIAPFLSNRIGKKQLFITVMAISALFTAFIYVLKPQNVVLIFVLGTLAELAAGIMPILFFAMLGDAADYGEFKTGRRTTGLIYSAGTFAMKFGGGVAGAVMIWVLKFYGYAGKDLASGGAALTQSDTAMIGVKLINSFVPVVFIGLAILLMIFYPLSHQKMEEIESELKQRRNK